MNIAHSIPSTVTNVSFSFLTSEDIRRISVKQIVNPVLLDDLNRPNIGGLYDPALGPSDRSDMFVYLRMRIGLRLMCFFADARHAILHILHAPAITDTSTYQPQYFTHFSWETCSTS